MPSQLTALIVDDEAPIRQLVQRVLDRAGLVTVTATDGVEAARVFAGGQRIDLLVTDVQMPEMNGDVLACELRKHDPDLNVVYLTAMHHDSMSLTHHDVLLVKPFTIAELLQAVSTATAGTVAFSRSPPRL
jgi:two-component system cell cycle sensor histidine kinase/response regulator CckA